MLFHITVSLGKDTKITTAVLVLQASLNLQISVISGDGYIVGHHVTMPDFRIFFAVNTAKSTAVFIK